MADNPQKRKRGSNYTPQEINKLMDLVNEYKSSVEDKRTGVIFLSRKKEAWEKICHSFNAVATSGIRTVEQLKIFYDNKKQKARKALAVSNKNEFMVKHTLSQNNVTIEELELALEHAKTDKGQYNKTGGGSWCPAVSEQDQKILEIIKDQVTPLPNSCDSASAYFGDEIAIEQIFEVQSEVMKSNEGFPVLASEIEQSSSIPSSQEYVLLTPKQATSTQNKKHVTTTTPRLSRKVKTKLVNYKNLYFKRKCQNAYLERRKIYQDIRLRQKEHTMLVKEHNLKIEIMKKEHEEKMKNNFD